MVDCVKFCRRVATSPALAQILGAETIDDAIPHDPQSDEYIRARSQRSFMSFSTVRKDGNAREGTSEMVKGRKGPLHTRCVITREPLKCCACCMQDFEGLCHRVSPNLDLQDGYALHTSLYLIGIDTWCFGFEFNSNGGDAVWSRTCDRPPGSVR